MTSSIGDANYVEAILARFSADPRKVVAYLGNGTRVSRGELSSLVHRMAHVLTGYGVGPGSTVTLLSGNRIEILAARYAVNLVGARVVFLYQGMASASQAHIVSDVDTDVLVVDAGLAAGATHVLTESPVKAVLTLGPCDIGEDLLELAAAAPLSPVPAHQFAPDEVWAIRHTGGTTGHPKGILMPHSTFAAVADYVGQADGYSEAAVMLVCTTVAHAAGYMIDSILVGGGAIVLHEHFDAGRVLADIAAYEVTHLYLLPPLLYQLLDHPAVATANTSSLRNVSYTGCPASPTRLRQAVARFGPVLCQVYGQTEAGIVTVLTPAEHTRPELLATVGRPLPGVSIRIVDADSKEAPVGQPGEVCVRPTTISPGYWRNPELTAKTWRDGWLHTGDVGHLDDEGYLHLSDRLQDMIIVVGGHVYPTEVEEVLLTHPAIAQAAVFGVPDADAGEQVHAVLVLYGKQSITEDEVRSFVTDRLGGMYAPHHVEIRTTIPLTDAGKPDKKLLRHS